MTCTKFEDFELGHIGAAEMRRHLGTCDDCRRQAVLDDRLMQEIASLRNPIDDIGLWSRIEAMLLGEAGIVNSEEKGTTEPAASRSIAPGRESGRQASMLKKAPPTRKADGSGAGQGRSRLPWSLARLVFPFQLPRLARTAGVAAAVLAAFGLAAWFLFLRPSPRNTSGLMAEAALVRVEKEEQEYAAAIKELEVKVGPKLAEMDLSLMALYRDRLETIDAQIERCREAIAVNPWNAHVRRYMLAALRDKQDTLARILSQQ
jgi:hypothetical protein